VRGVRAVCALDDSAAASAAATSGKSSARAIFPASAEHGTAASRRQMARSSDPEHFNQISDQVPIPGREFKARHREGPHGDYSRLNGMG
jgi:hypothetical protein